MIYNGTTLVFKHLTDSVHGEDFSGECQYEFNQAASDFIRSHYGRGDDADYPDMLTDNLEQMDLEEDEGCIHCTDADGFILMMNAIEYAEDSSQFEVVCYYDHIIWLFHDLCHIANDATDYDVEVNEYVEQRAITTSIELCIENKISVPWDIIRKTQTEYKERFNTPLVLGDFEQHGIDTTAFTTTALN